MSVIIYILHGVYVEKKGEVRMRMYSYIIGRISVLPSHVLSGVL